MDIGEQRNAEAHHVATQRRHSAIGALKRNGKRRSGRHGANSGQIRRAVLAKNLERILSRIGASDAVQNGKPNVMANNNDKHHREEYGQLARDGALIRKAAKRGGDKERQNRNNHARHNSQNDTLELIEQLAHEVCMRPYRSKAKQNGEHERAHDGHDLRNIKLEHDIGQLFEPIDRCGDRQVGNDRVTGEHREQRGANARAIRDKHSHTKNARHVRAELRYGRRNEADDDERNAEHDDLAEHVLDRHNHVHNRLVGNKANENAHDHRHEQDKRQTGEKLLHENLRANMRAQARKRKQYHVMQSATTRYGDSLINGRKRS